MLFALMTKDKVDHLQTRLDNRAAHLAYVKESGVVAMAGPLLDDAGDMCGSLVILDVPDRNVAETWAENDPYAKAGLFETVTITAWKKVIG
ncbi:MAG: YciI family protein [Pseudomonadota bacterium]